MLIDMIQYFLLKCHLVPSPMQMFAAHQDNVSMFEICLQDDFMSADAALCQLICLSELVVK